MTGPDREQKSWIPDDSTFGARLALVRQRMHWGNVKEAATACGLPTESWRSWERDGRDPRGLINVCLKIAGVTGVDLNWLAVGPIERMTNAAESAEIAPAAFTKKLFGERVVAVVGKKPDRAIDSLPPSGEGRTRPINRQPSRQLVSHTGRY